LADWATITSQIATTLTLLKQAGGLVREVVPLVQSSEAKEKLNEIREQLLDASERINDLRAVNNEIADRNLVLEGELREIKAFISNKNGYIAHKLGRGAFVYVSEMHMDNPEKAPWYCQHCFEVEFRLSPINYQKGAPNRLAIFECQSCGATIEDYPRN